MLHLINPDRDGDFEDDLAEMHRLRCPIFKERLGFGVQVSGDMEVDEFDACRAIWMLPRECCRQIQLRNADGDPARFILREPLHRTLTKTGIQEAMDRFNRDYRSHGEWTLDR